jgi:DNA-binding transcriptional regulator YiaG
MVMAKKKPEKRNRPAPLLPPELAKWTPDKIKAFREGKKWTRADLADALGVNPRTVMYYENGRQAPSLPVLKLLQLLSKS